MDPLRRWLADDGVLFLIALVVVVVVVAAAACLWHSITPAPSFLSAALAAIRVPAPPVQQQPPAIQSSVAQEHPDRKSTRSKERRRRGKDPLRDLFKGGKKSRALLRAIKVADSPAPDAPPSPSELANDAASSVSRSPSPELASSLTVRDRLALPLCAESDDGSALGTTPNSHSSAVVSSADTSDHSSEDACSRSHSVRPHSVSPDSMSPADTAANVSTASTVIQHADAPASPLISADVRTPQPRDSQAVSTSVSVTKLVRARTRLRAAKIDAGVKPQLLLPALPDSVASALACAAPCPSLSVIPSTHSADGAGPSTPTNSRGPTPPSLSMDAQPLDQRAVQAQIQLASMHSALEAARLREEQLRAEAEQASKERDELCWRWNEDAGAWRRREAELQSQIHHLMQQLQAYAAIASFQAQQVSGLPSSGFSSPTSPHVQHHPLAPFPLPLAIQTQNSASPPAHVQALLASTPMLTSHPGFAALAPYPGAGHGKSPVWSGMGPCVPGLDLRQGGCRTPDSSASGSSSRGRRRRRRAEDVQGASDESSLGDWDGSGDEDGQEEEDIFENNALADAILKRPESIRGLGGKRSCRRPASTHGLERMDALKDPGAGEPPLVER